MFLSGAPEFRGIKGWINSGPLELKGLRGKVVLLDFWAYSCVNCLRTLPHLKGLWERYRGKGLVLVGVHTPEFDFERNGSNVEKAVKRLGIPYPVALDSANETWKAYGNQYWPRQALIDSRGRAVWEHSGEGGYQEMEEWVRKLLELAGQQLLPWDGGKDEDGKGFLSRAGLSPEIYCGSSRNGGLGSSGVCLPSGICKYLDTEKEHQRDVLYPEGEWTQRTEALVHTGKEGSLSLKYRAREVNAVMDGKGRVEILLDGKRKGSLVLDGARMYTLVEGKGQEERELRLVFRGKASIYAFTFG